VELPKGRVYISFPVWTQELLAEVQAKKALVEEVASEFRQEKDLHLQKYQDEPNFLMKLVHYRNAAAAVEKLDMSGVHAYVHIPDSDNVMTLQDGLLVGMKGSVYHIQSDFLATKKFIGEAELRPQKVAKDDINQLRP